MGAAAPALQEPINGDKVDAEADSRYLLLKGATADGRKFRPSDWADRLLGCVSTYAGSNTELYRQMSDNVCLTEREGMKGIVIDSHLKEIEPMLYRFLYNFAQDNHLVIENLDEEGWNHDHRRVIAKPKRAFT